MTLKEQARKWVNENQAEYGAYALGHAFIWFRAGKVRETCGYAAGVADLQGLCDGLKEAFPEIDLVWYNLD